MAVQVMSSSSHVPLSAQSGEEDKTWKTHSRSQCSSVTELSSSFKSFLQPFMVTAAGALKSGCYTGEGKLQCFSSVSAAASDSSLDTQETWRWPLMSRCSTGLQRCAVITSKCPGAHLTLCSLKPFLQQRSVLSTLSAPFLTSHARSPRLYMEVTQRMHQEITPVKSRWKILYT